MNEKEIKRNIKKFINLVLEKYDNIFIAFEYSAISECYEIWHNREDLEFKDVDFKKFTGKLLFDMFLSKGFYNIYISYDYEKSKKLLIMMSISSIHNIKYKEVHDDSIKWMTNSNQTSYNNKEFSAFETKVNMKNLNINDEYSMKENKDFLLAA